MNRYAAIAAAITALGIGTIGANSAFAQNNDSQQDEAEMQAMQSAKVSLAEAVKAAESKSGGKAAEAAFANENGKSGYEISLVATDGTEKTVMVDPTSGAVTKMMTSNVNETNEQKGHEDSEDGHEDGQGGDTEHAD